MSTKLLLTLALRCETFRSTPLSAPFLKPSFSSHVSRAIVQQRFRFPDKNYFGEEREVIEKLQTRCSNELMEHCRKKCPEGAAERFGAILLLTANIRVRPAFTTLIFSFLVHDQHRLQSDPSVRSLRSDAIRHTCQRSLPFVKKNVFSTVYFCIKSYSSVSLSLWFPIVSRLPSVLVVFVVLSPCISCRLHICDTKRVKHTDSIAYGSS